MPRIVIVGSSCAGKSTLAAKLGRELGIPAIHLDELSWLPNWVEQDREVLKQLVADNVAEHPHWVIDGNYRLTHHLSWPHAQVIVWLNYSYPRVIWQALKRTVRRTWTGEKIFADNVETFRRSFLSKDSILLWVIRDYHYRRRQIGQIRKDNKYSHLHWVEFRHPKQSEGLIGTLADLGVLEDHF